MRGKNVYERSLFSGFIGSGSHEGTGTQNTKGKVNETVQLKVRATPASQDNGTHR